MEVAVKEQVAQDIQFLGRGQYLHRFLLLCVVRRQESAQARYEGWRDWTMPVEGRQTIRLAADFAPPVTAPDAFLDESARAWKKNQKDFLCNITEMIAAAKEAGALGER